MKVNSCYECVSNKACKERSILKDTAACFRIRQSELWTEYQKRREYLKNNYSRCFNLLDLIYHELSMAGLKTRIAVKIWDLYYSIKHKILGHF